jgi:zinc transport system ATP-binding protein
MSLVKVNNLTVKYKVGNKVTKALDDIDLSVESGDYLCIIGSNGSGKSSLLKALLGLVPTNGGSVNIGISKDETSYLPQINSIPSDFPATVGEIVLSGTQKNRKHLPFYKQKNHIDTDMALSSIGLLNLKKRKFGELSGGQQQRVLLARALVKDPKLLFLDEPCSGLDEAVCSQFYNILKKLNKEKNVTVIMVSHDSLQVERYATKVLHLSKKVVFYGNINSWKRHHQHVSCLH